MYLAGRNPKYDFGLRNRVKLDWIQNWRSKNNPLINNNNNKNNKNKNNNNNNNNNNKGI